MTITTPLHVDHQLDQLAGQLRTGARHGRTPTRHSPRVLEHAVALAAALPPSRVAKQLRVRLADLKKQMAAHHEPTAALSPLPLGFVEVPPAPSWPQPTAVPQIELSRADGPRLCIDCPASALPLAAVVRAFVEGRSCCN